MTKKQLLTILIGLAIAAIVIILALRWFLRPQIEQNAPPSSTVVPPSATAGIETWTGDLTLTETEAKFKVDEKVFRLVIPQTDTVAILKGQGYKNGDRVNVMGQLRGENEIKLLGLNRLMK